jgi:hypothetical protein
MGTHNPLDLRIIKGNAVGGHNRAILFAQLNNFVKVFERDVPATSRAKAQAVGARPIGKIKKLNPSIQSESTYAVMHALGEIDHAIWTGIDLMGVVEIPIGRKVHVVIGNVTDRALGYIEKKSSNPCTVQAVPVPIGGGDSM